MLLEGQALLRDLLAKALRADPRFELVADVDDPLEAESICRQTRPDLLVADVRLPQADGIRFIAGIRGACDSTRILVLSQAADPLTLHRLRDLGVHGFVEKDQTLEILEEAMVEVASGGSYFTAVWSRAEARVRNDPKAFSRILSAREQDVLRLVAAGQTSKSIAAQLGLSLRSVETYRYRMMRKLGIATTAGLIEFGLRLTLTLAGSGAADA